MTQELVSIIEEHQKDVEKTTPTNELLLELNQMLSNTHVQPQYKLSTKGVNIVDKILGDKTENNHQYFNILWKDQTTSWIPIENISRYTLRLYYLQKEKDNFNKTILSPRHTAYIYLRTSRPQINDSQVSLAVQKQDMMKYCYDNNIHIADITFDEGTSARNMKRLEGLNLILNDIQPNNILMTWDISRFSRNTNQAIQLLDELSKKEINVFFLKENLSYQGAMGKHQIRLALSSSQLHSDTVSEKVKAALQYKKSKGNYIGGRPRFGYKVEKVGGIRKVKKSTREQKEISLIKKLCNKYKQTSGHNTLYTEDYETIANLLNSKHMRFRGKPFTRRNVSLVLNR